VAEREVVITGVGIVSPIGVGREAVWNAIQARQSGVRPLPQLAAAGWIAPFGGEIADFDRVFIGGADTFLYKGTNGRWRDLLTAEEVAMFDEQSRRRLPADANTWANRHSE